MSDLLHGAADQPALSGAGVSPTLHTIFVHVGVTPEDLPRLRAAAALARRFGATLCGVGCEEMLPLGAVDPTSLAQGAWAADLERQVEVDLKHAHSVFEAETVGLKTEWTALEAMPAQALVRLSRDADLIVADGRPLSQQDRYRSAEAAEVLLFAGRPVLFAPPKGGVLEGHAVVIAWKDSREARRALADALPLVAGAETVLVVEVCSEPDFAGARARTAAVVAGLKRHGIIAHARAVVASPDRVVIELNRAAEAIGADLIVAGGYGHSRLGEWIFGGVTRDLLRQPERFVLLSH